MQLFWSLEFRNGEGIAKLGEKSQCPERQSLRPQTIVFKGYLTSDSDGTSLFKLVYGTSVQKVLILKGIIQLEAKVEIAQ